MKTLILFLGLILLSVTSCSPNKLNPSNVQWAPTIEDVAREPDVKMVVFLRDNGITPEGNLAPIKDWEEIGRIEEPEKIERVIEAFETGHCCRCEDDCVPLWSTWMGVINKKNQGLLINLGWQHWTKRVEWRTHYSEELYNILTEYGIIRPQK
jgi:hypothetical protein